MLAHLAVNGKSRACVNGLAQLRPARPVQHAVVRKERGRVAHEALEAVVAPVGLLLPPVADQVRRSLRAIRLHVTIASAKALQILAI